MILEINTISTSEALTYLYHSLNRQIIGYKAKLDELEIDRSFCYSEWFQKATDMEIQKTLKHLSVLNRQMAEITELMMKEGVDIL